MTDRDRDHDETDGRLRAASNGNEPSNRDTDERASEFKVFDRRFWASEDTVQEDAEERSEVPSYVEQLQRQVAEKDKQLREYIAAYKREVVENLEQTKARLERDAEQKARGVRGEMAGPMMEILETLERSIAVSETSTDVDALREGMKMVHLLLMQKLKDLGLDRIETVGKPFDPAIHEAVAVVRAADPSQDNVVINELSPGFILEGRVVRAPKVQVAKVQN